MVEEKSSAEASFMIIKNLLEDPTSFSLTRLKSIAENIDLKDKKSLIDVALRGRMLRLLAMDSLDDVKTLLKVGVAAALANLCSAPTPFLLFADVFNTKPISTCQELFSFMEETIITLKDVPLFGSGRNTLLRMCNDLLRRLSKSQNTVFCGQIQLFLTRLFPLDEKSGLNFMSNFNLEKDVLYNKNPDPSIFKHHGCNESLNEDLEEGEMTESSAPVEVDASLYVKFWSLQEFFKAPTLCYEKQKWQRFVNSTDTVLEIFSSIKLINAEDNDLHFQTSGKKFSKYLTSEKLLDLQLMDCSFRRYILVQLLLIFQFLTTPTKFKTSEQVLNEEQQNWVNTKHDIVLHLLSSGNPDDDAPNSFVSIVERILERETFWNRWKNEGCPSFVRPLEKSPFNPRKRRANPLINRAGERLLRFGNKEIERLWNFCPDNLKACKDPTRFFKPELHTYFQDAILELDPAEKVDEEYKSINKEEWSWRALRFLSRRCPHFYINWNPPGRSVKDYLTVILTEKIQAEEDRKNVTSANSSLSATDAAAASDSSNTDLIPAKQPRLDDSIETATPPKTRASQQTRSSASGDQNQSNATSSSSGGRPQSSSKSSSSKLSTVPDVNNETPELSNPNSDICCQDIGSVENGTDVDSQSDEDDEDDAILVEGDRRTRSQTLNQTRT